MVEAGRESSEEEPRESELLIKKQWQGRETLSRYCCEFFLFTRRRGNMTADLSLRIIEDVLPYKYSKGPFSEGINVYFLTNEFSKLGEMESLYMGKWIRC